MTDLPKRIYLVGLRGSGKTTVGRQLAVRLSWEFIDIDDCIETSAGRTIADIFAVEGEAGFREREAAALAGLSTRPDHVIATGGGVVLRDENRRRLQETGYCVWLTAGADMLWDRVQNDPSTKGRRPALTALPGPEEVRHLLTVRAPLYGAVAHLTVATEGRSPDAAVSAILAVCSTSLSASQS